MPRATQAVALVPHPATPCAAVQSLRVHVQREPQALFLRYVLAGDLGRLRIPAPRPPARADGLWRHTCFEVFVASHGVSAYREFNFSPTGEWAAYAFARYRDGATTPDCPPPVIACRRSDDGLELHADAACAPEGRLRVGLSAVVEDARGVLSYWALRHPCAKPDFHHAESFALEIDEIRH